MTVGTPFVELRKERLLFFRLPLIYKALFVASLMLFFMFAFNFVFELIEGSVALTNTTRLTRYAIAGGFMTLPFIAFLLASFFKERGRLYFYRDRVQTRAREWFSPRWLALTHEDDEAVRGLGSLDKVRFEIFSRDFAVPLLSLLSVFMLPVAYIALVTSPTAMLSIANFMRTSVYKLDTYQRAEQQYETRRRELRKYRRDIRALEQRRANEERVGRDLEITSEIRKLQTERRDLRQKMRSEFQEFDGIARALRFKRRFLQQNGRACENTRLCGGGESLAINSRLLFHIATDEAASLVTNDNLGIGGWAGRLIRSLIPILLVPLVFAIVAIALVYLVQFLARLLSGRLSRTLDRMTWSEIKRSALGNDTEAEVALASGPQPPWMDEGQGPPYLPGPLAEQITEASNRATAASIAKFRNALSDLAFAENKDSREQTALAFLTWRELIHFAYFDVADFRKLVAASLQQAGAVKNAPPVEDVRVAGWLSALNGHAVMTGGVVPTVGVQVGDRSQVSRTPPSEAAGSTA